MILFSFNLIEFININKDTIPKERLVPNLSMSDNYTIQEWIELSAPVKKNKKCISCF